MCKKIKLLEFKDDLSIDEIKKKFIPLIKKSKMKNGVK